MSSYRVDVLDNEENVVTSRVEQSLLEAAKTMLAFANYVHDTEPGLLDPDGCASVRIRELGERELDDAEKETVRVYLEEYGASRHDRPDGIEGWSI